MSIWIQMSLQLVFTPVNENMHPILIIITLWL